MAKILIVDVDARLAQALAGQLRAQGHSCRLATSGKEAIEVARTHLPDLFLIEVMMPDGVSGFEICRRVRSDDALFLTPVLLMSAMAMEEEIKHGLAQGTDDYVQKPFELSVLLQRVDALIRANADVRQPDPVSGLPVAGAIKREVQKRVCRQERFAVANIEIMHLRSFVQRGAEGDRGRPIRHLADILDACREKHAPGNFSAGHMGSGYFVCVMDPEHAQPFCEAVIEEWKSKLQSLYESAGLTAAYHNATVGDHRTPLLDLLLCVTARSEKDNTSSLELFETLSQLRNNVLANDTPGLHFDRRAWHRGLFR